MPSPRIVMLNWDGTLVDSLPWTYQAACAVFLHFNREPPTFEIYRAEILKLRPAGFFQKYGVPETALWPTPQVIYETYLLKHLDDLNLRDGAREVLGFCKDRRIRVAIVNCLVPGELLYTLERLGIGHLIDHVQAYSYGGLGIASVLAHFGIEAEEAVYVDSSAKGLEAAKEFAGIKIIALTGSFQPSEKILAKNAACVITTLMDLPFQLDNDTSGVG